MTNKDIEHDLLKIIDKLDELDQKVINLNYKLNQHIKEGHIPNGQNISDTGASTIFTGVRDNSPDPV